MKERLREHWPQVLWVVRHGQSAANVARAAAEAADLHAIDIAGRDIDTPLSQLGRQQAHALGLWFARLPDGQQPDVLLCSPYVRARQTAELLMQASGLRQAGLRLRIDERLREKEFGIIDGLTKRGIREKYPQLSVQRTHVGKFYFRPPGGESWCDVILRLRSLVEMVTREHGGQRVLIIGHQVIVNCMRYLIECMDEAQILGIDRLGDVPNCAVTSYRYDGGKDELALELVNFVAPLREAGAPVTVEPDAQAAPKP